MSAADPAPPEPFPADSTPAAGARAPDWARILPDADHRWTMGLRPGHVADFFAAWDSSGAMRAERAHWLNTEPERYASLPEDAEPALGDTVALARRLGVPIEDGLPPHVQLQTLGRMWEPDFVWMRCDDEGRHRLIGGVLCFPSSWDLREKLGQPMHAIHAPVPGLNPALERQIEVFLSRLTPGTAWTRENANFSRDARFNHHPSRPRTRFDASVTLEEFHLRLEHQLLLRLRPKGDILFGIRVEIIPIAAVLANRGAGRRLRRMLATISPEGAAYKGIGTARDRLVELLDEQLGRL
ncbi:MAG: DUF3445 domain-containing protein [Planctomyces sp.]|nr:DUF3445 domain-containing protein [Planctomyces sp.]